MSLTFLSILVIFALQNQVFSSPVLLWSNTKFPEKNVHFGTVSSLHLIDDSICALSAKQIQLRLLAVQDLTLEDIQRGAQRNHPVLLNAKLNTENFHFYPNTADDIYSKLSLIPQSNDFKCSKIHFEIVSAKIYENLEDALNIIQTTIDNTNQDQTVVIALTSTDNTSSRKRRATEQSTNQILRSSDKSCMVYVEKLRYSNITGSKYKSQNYSLNYNASSCVPGGVNGTTVNLNLVWINDNAPFDTLTMLLTTILKGRYWYLENATIANINQYRYFAYGMRSKMDTPPTYSYACNSANFIRYNATLTDFGSYNFSDQFFLTGFQFQPYNTNGSFGPPNYCTSFFTSGIWMGITSSLLCLGILLFGIRRMMTIKSNDRFDDPKGKPLVIKAQE